MRIFFPLLFFREITSSLIQQGGGLAAMVGQLTYGKRQWESLDGQMRKLIPIFDKARYASMQSAFQKTISIPTLFQNIFQVRKWLTLLMLIPMLLTIT